MHVSFVADDGWSFHVLEIPTHNKSWRSALQDDLMRLITAQRKALLQTFPDREAFLDNPQQLQSLVDNQVTIEYLTRALRNRQLGKQLKPFYVPPHFALR